MIPEPRPDHVEATPPPGDHVPWLVTVTVAGPQPAARAELVGSTLWDLGAEGIIEQPGSGQPDAGPEAVTLIAGFPDRDGADRAARALASDPAATVVGIEPAPPLERWIEPEARSNVELDNGVTFDLVPGSSFGHGGHPTTRLALDLLTEPAAGAEVVVDIGCGSGVLTIAALLSGARRAVAFDIDPAAVAATDANLRSLGLRDRVTLFTGTIEAMGRSAPAPDLIVANVLLVAHRDIAAAASDLAGADATLITAGYLADQARHVDALYPDFVAVDRASESGWVAERRRRPGRP